MSILQKIGFITECPPLSYNVNNLRYSQSCTFYEALVKRALEKHRAG